MKSRIALSLAGTVVAFLVGIGSLSAGEPPVSVSKAQSLAAQAAGKAPDTLKHRETLNMPGALEYRFEADDAIYGVNANTGEIQTAYYRRGLGKDVRVDLASAEGRATATAARFFKDFHIAGLQKMSSQLMKHGDSSAYEFLWREVRNGVPYPTFVRVTVDPTTGEVATYAARKVQVDQAPKVNLTQEAAIAEAKQLAPGLEKIGASDLDVWVLNGQPIARWTILLQSDDGLVGLRITLDATTGLEIPETRSGYNARGR